MDILIVMDVQKQFKNRDGENYGRILEFISKNRGKFDRVLATVFKNSRGSLFESRLGYTGCMNATKDDIEFKASEVIEKKSYALDVECYVNRDRDAVYLIGCDIDACLMATAFRLWDGEYNFKVIEDYVYTTSKKVSNDTMIKVMRRNFGSNVIKWEEVKGEM